jgi:hypothetical protein
VYSNKKGTYYSDESAIKELLLQVDRLDQKLEEMEIAKTMGVKTYTISLKGCDDTTRFSIDLLDSEYKLVQKLSELSKKTGTSQCMPKLEIQEGKFDERD